MKPILPLIVCSLLFTSVQAQEKPEVRVEQENGKYGAVNVNLQLPVPPKKKKKNDRDPLTRPWFVAPEYDSLEIVKTFLNTRSYHLPTDTLALLIGKKGEYYTCFYDICNLLYTDWSRSRALEGFKPIVTEEKKVVRIKAAPISKEIKSQPIAIQGENGKWAVGTMPTSYLYFTDYKYDSVEFAPVTNEVSSNEYTAKGTWVVYKNDKKFYVDPKGGIREFVGNSKRIQYIAINIHSGFDKVLQLFTKDGKYGILSQELVLPAVYDTILAPERLYDGYHGLAFAKQNNFYKLFDLQSEQLIQVPIDIVRYKSFFGDVFLQSSEGKWHAFDGIKLKFDSTAYDFLFDNIPGRILLMSKTKTLSYFGERPKSVVKGEGPGVAMPAANESYSYVLPNGLIHYTDNRTGLQGMKYADGRIFVHPAYVRAAPSGYTDSKIFNNPNSKPEEWLYEFTKGDIAVIGSVNPETQIITGYSVCGKCDGYGYTYLETTEVVKGETKTYHTSPVQTLKSEAFDVKTGTWKKTYSNVSQQVTTTTPDKTIERTERKACSVCHGKPKTNYIIKWDGKTYVMTKQQ